ncbi:F0F1 ATP synthase subunit delta [uncultured Parabacteroides sp.]|jgi:F-type H+-transporting ATPase subunit delta|uniref:F0F1 ATP synthase subunit delta n=1 Tax=uncultured Parabacteroides sp. TaxID=512312 RepID=UPI0025FA2D44|nr:F0F1 ATP synthase subunit delta [uncultured Parabacteroides sp.]
MDVGTISSRYVKALFSLAKEKKQETRVYDDMKMLATSFEQEPGLKAVLDNPIFPPEEKVKLLTTAAGLEVSELFTRFIRLVLQHKRESLLLLMTHIYIHMYRKDKKITRVLFKTPVPVDEATQEHLKRRLQEETGNTIEFTGVLRPELIGGFVLRIGNIRIDASYSRQLREIKNKLIERN